MTNWLQKDMIRNSQMEEMHRARYVGRDASVHVLCHVPSIFMVANPEAHQTFFPYEFIIFF